MPSSSGCVVCLLSRRRSRASLTIATNLASRSSSGEKRPAHLATSDHRHNLDRARRCETGAGKVPFPRCPAASKRMPSRLRSSLSAISAWVTRSSGSTRSTEMPGTPSRSLMADITAAGRDAASREKSAYATPAAVPKVASSAPCSASLSRTTSFVTSPSTIKVNSHSRIATPPLLDIALSLGAAALRDSRGSSGLTRSKPGNSHMHSRLGPRDGPKPPRPATSHRPTHRPRQLPPSLDAGSALTYPAATCWHLSTESAESGGNLSLEPPERRKRRSSGGSGRKSGHAMVRQWSVRGSVKTRNVPYP